MKLSGDQAFARGALDAGVAVVTGYPGSPSSGTLEAVLALTRREAVHVEWSANEKVALEVAIGASLAGRRALVCVKSVGMNVLVDPLMTVNLTGVDAGLVVLLGDDPGAYGSQNDQDTRPLVEFAELPLIEPLTLSDAAAAMVEAFDLSEELETVVVVRETRRFAARRERIENGPRARRPARRRARSGPTRRVTHPRNSVELHRRLHEKLSSAERWAESSSFNRVSGGGRRGVVACGGVWADVAEILGDGRDDVRLLGLATLHPLPRQLLSGFLRDCDAVLVIEENEPFVELRAMALAHVAGVDTSIHGSLDGRVPREGDLRPGELRAILAAWNDRSPGAPAAHGGSPGAALADEADDDRPPREDHCAGCPFPAIVDAVRAAAVETGGEPLLVGDPGCLVKAVDRLHAKFAMGSAAAVVQGLRHGGVDRPVVALFGDSAFFHTAIPAIINAVQHAVDVLFVVLDNAATVTSGFQPNPGTGRDARGRESPSLSITRIASACGVELVRVVEEGGDVGAPVREGLEHPGPALVVVRSRCERSERTE